MQFYLNVRGPYKLLVPGLVPLLITALTGLKLATSVAEQLQVVAKSHEPSSKVPWSRSQMIIGEFFYMLPFSKCENSLWRSCFALANFSSRTQPSCAWSVFNHHCPSATTSMANSSMRRHKARAPTCCKQSSGFYVDFFSFGVQQRRSKL